MVRKGGFEPPRLSAPPPQDGVSASSTTSALAKKYREFHYSKGGYWARNLAASTQLGPCRRRRCGSYRINGVPSLRNSLPNADWLNADG